MEIKVLLACNAGMSTGMLIKKMEQAATERGVDLTVEAMPVEGVKAHAAEYDVLLLGPQIKYQMRALKQQLGDSLPIDAIDMSAYGLMDGAKVLDQALELAGK